MTEAKLEEFQKTAFICHYDIPSEGFAFLRENSIDSPQEKLMKRLDGAMDTLSKKINEISALADERKKSAVASRYRGELKDIQSMRDLAAQLGINADEKFNLLESLTRKAISVVS